jgi:hypothetical protein
MRFPILVATIGAVPREKSHGRGFASVRQRKRRIRAGRRRGGDARHDFKINAMRGEMIHLFAEPTKDARIAALEADNQATLTDLADEHRVNLILGHRVNPTALTDRDNLRGRGNLFQQGIPWQGVMDDDIRLLEQTQAPYGDQIGGPRSGTDEDHPAYVAIYHLFKLDRFYVILGNLIKY